MGFKFQVKVRSSELVGESLPKLQQEVLEIALEGDTVEVFEVFEDLCGEIIESYLFTTYQVQENGD